MTETIAHVSISVSLRNWTRTVRETKSLHKIRSIRCCYFPHTHTHRLQLKTRKVLVIKFQSVSYIHSIVIAETTSTTINLKPGEGMGKQRNEAATTASCIFLMLSVQTDSDTSTSVHLTGWIVCQFTSASVIKNLSIYTHVKQSQRFRGPP